MTRPRKFRPGPVIREPMAVLAIAEKGRAMFVNGRYASAGFIISMQYYGVAVNARRGAFRLAVPNLQPKEQAR